MELQQCWNEGYFRKGKTYIGETLIMGWANPDLMPRKNLPEDWRTPPPFPRLQEFFP
jgi:hypothetical protein